MSDEQIGSEKSVVAGEYVHRAMDVLDITPENNLAFAPVRDFVKQNYDDLLMAAEAIYAKDEGKVLLAFGALAGRLRSQGLVIGYGEASDAKNPAWLEKTNDGSWKMVIDRELVNSKSGNLLAEVVHEWGAWSLMGYHRSQDKSELLQLRSRQGKMVPQTHLVDATLQLMIKDLKSKG